MTLRIILGVIIGGILGCIATGAVVALVAGGDFVGFVTTWGKYGVSIAIAIGLPFIFMSMERGMAIVAGFVWGDVIAALVTKLIYAAPAPWGAVMGFNAVYAIVAVLVYAAIARPHRRRIAAV